MTSPFSYDNNCHINLKLLCNEYLIVGYHLAQFSPKIESPKTGEKTPFFRIILYR